MQSGAEDPRPIAPRKNNRSPSKNLTRAVRLLRVQTLAEETSGDVVKANAWFRRPLAELHGESPLVVAQTEAGARVVETILG